MNENKSFSKSQRHSVYEAAMDAAKMLKISKFAARILIKDLMLLASGTRTSVLVDYFASRSLSKDLIAVICKARSIRHEFGPLRVARMCEGNFLLVHIDNFIRRLRESIILSLDDYVFVDCSASLSRPELLSRNVIESLLLPHFRRIVDAASSISYIDSELDIGGDHTEAPLPTLAGWLLQYPVIYYTTSAGMWKIILPLVKLRPQPMNRASVRPMNTTIVLQFQRPFVIFAGNCLANLPLHLHRFSLTEPIDSSLGIPSASSDHDMERLQEVFSFTVPTTMCEAAAPFISAHLERIRHRSIESGDAGPLFRAVKASVAVLTLPAVAL